MPPQQLAWQEMDVWLIGKLIMVFNKACQLITRNESDSCVKGTSD